MVLAPGFALQLLVLGPGRASFAVRAAVVVPLGYAAVAATALMLALLHVLVLPLLSVVLAAVTAVSLVVAVARRRANGASDPWREEMVDQRWLFAAAAVLFLGFVLVRLTFSPVLNLGDQTPLRYWADGVEMADARAVPEVSLQWGTLAPPATSKVVLNAFHAAAVLLVGRGPLEPMGALLLLVSCGLFLATFALALELGLRRFALLVPLVLFANALAGPRDPTLDLLNAKAENWGRLVVFAGLLLFLRAWRERGDDAGRRRVEAVVAGLLLGLGAGTHLVPTIVMLSFTGAYAASGVVFRAASIREVGVAAAITAAATVAVAAFVLLAPGGDVGFEGAGRTAEYRRLAAELGLPADFDLTRYLALGQVEQPPHPGAFYEPPGAIYHEFVRRTVGQQVLRRPFLWLMPVAAVAALAVALALGAREVRALAAAAFATAVLLLVVALLFDLRFDVYVLAVFGPRRLFDYPGVFAALLGVAALESLSRARVMTAVGLAAAVLFAAASLPRAVAPAGRERELATALPPLAWVAERVPCEGRVLADRRTLATFETLTRHAGVLEGMGPYLRPALLETALRELFAAEAFFASPEEAYLRERGVAAVVTTTPGQTLGGVGAALKVGAADPTALDDVPFLRLVAASDTMRVYEVVGAAEVPPPRPLPNVSDLPGYRCGG